MNCEKDYKNNNTQNLTKLGKYLLEKSGAKKIIDNIIFPKAGKQKLDKEYFTETNFDSLKNFVKSFNLKSLKDFVDSNLTFKGKSLAFEDILEVMTIYLRNKYLNEYFELSKKE